MTVLVPLTASQLTAALAAVEGALEDWDFHDEDESSIYQADVIAVREALLAPVSQDDLGVLVEALDSHAYWQLSDEKYRDSGYVQSPGSDDLETAAVLAEVTALQERLASLLEGSS